jgi:hypothetical protein
MLDHLRFTPVSVDFKPAYLAEPTRPAGLEEIALLTVLEISIEIGVSLSYHATASMNSIFW